MSIHRPEKIGPTLFGTSKLISLKLFIDLDLALKVWFITDLRYFDACLIPKTFVLTLHIALKRTCYLQCNSESEQLN